jgi:hypothetical protein
MRASTASIIERARVAGSCRCQSTSNSRAWGGLLQGITR